MLDGLSIAWSVIEHLHSSIKCRTLASTHYHQLAKLAHILPRVDCYHVTAKHSKDGLSFTFKVTVSKKLNLHRKRQIKIIEASKIKDIRKQTSQSTID